MHDAINPISIIPEAYMAHSGAVFRLCAWPQQGKGWRHAVNTHVLLGSPSNMGHCKPPYQVPPAESGLACRSEFQHFYRRQHLAFNKL